MGLNSSTQYFYRVQAENRAGTTALSITIGNARTLAPVPFTGSVFITGTAQVGQTLTAAMSNLSGSGGGEDTPILVRTAICMLCKRLMWDLPLPLS